MFSKNYQNINSTEQKALTLSVLINYFPNYTAPTKLFEQKLDPREKFNLNNLKNNNFIRKKKERLIFTKIRKSSSKLQI